MLRWWTFSFMITMCLLCKILGLQISIWSAPPCVHKIPQKPKIKSNQVFMLIQCNFMYEHHDILMRWCNLTQPICLHVHCGCNITMNLGCHIESVMYTCVHITKCSMMEQLCKSTIKQWHVL